MGSPEQDQREEARRQAYQKLGDEVDVGTPLADSEARREAIDTVGKCVSFLLVAKMPDGRLGYHYLRPTMEDWLPLAEGVLTALNVETHGYLDDVLAALRWKSLKDKASMG